MYLSPLRSAVVRRPATSDPAVRRTRTVSNKLRRKQLQQWSLTIRLRHSETKPNASIQDFRQEALFLLLIAEVDEGWSSDAVSTGQAPDDAQVSATGHFVQNDQIVEAVPLVRFYICRKTDPVQIVCRHGVNCGGHVASTAVFSKDLSSGQYVRITFAVQLQRNIPLQVQNLDVPIAHKTAGYARRRIASPPSAGECETLCSTARLCDCATAVLRMGHC